jgi:CcmD family protein
MKKLVFIALLLLNVTAVFAQQNKDVEMADVFMRSGRIYVVVATVAIVFAGLAIYLFAIDRRLKKIEKNK